MQPVDHEKIMREHEREMQQHRDMTLWVHFANLALGLWVLTSPFTLGYIDLEPTSDVLRVTAERDLPAPAVRNLAMAWSDVLSGALLVLFAGFSLRKRASWWAQWGAAAVGVWLLFAPLVLWTPSAAAYANATLVGSLVITFSVLVPMMPGMSMKAMATGPDIPPGWQYSPSTWVQRLPIVALALVGFLIARHLAAYQLGHIGFAWDPFFGRGTERIITSDVSRAWPVADAGLGAAAYMLEALSGLMGDKRRWRTMPWMVAMFGALVIPLGAVSIFFIIIQPVMIGTWCTLCLVAALAMVVMIPYAVDEVVAMGQFLVQSRRAGAPFWSTFFHGGTLEGGAREHAPTLGAPTRPLARELLLGGVNYPWTLVICVLLGAWLMFTRVTFGSEGVMANSDHVVGALVITFTLFAMAEVARPVRFINVWFGLWLIAAPWLIAGVSDAAAWNSIIVGAALIVLSLPRGRIARRYGSWDRLVA